MNLSVPRTIIQIRGTQNGGYLYKNGTSIKTKQPMKNNQTTK